MLHHHRLATSLHVFGSDWNGTYKPFYFFIYSAFYDSRTFHKIPQVNVFGIVKIKVLRSHKLFCKFMSNGMEVVVQGQTFTSVTEDRTSGGIGVSTFILWCRVERDIPSQVTVLLQIKNGTKLELGSSIVETMPKVEKKSSSCSLCMCTVRP